jgi:hypothetical protein
MKRSNRLPNFLVIGAMKAGTTSLYHYLRDHPQIFMSETKELNFFNPLRNWRRGLRWYGAHFAEAGPDVVAVGEASTSYTKFPWIQDVPARIASVLGDVRFIYVVRDPVERIQSHYLHYVVIGQETRPIEEALLADPRYLSISRYALQLERYAPFFGRDRFLIVDSRDLRDDRAATMRRVFRFLEVDDRWVPPTLDREFLRSEDRPMRPTLLRKLRRAPRIRSLGRYMPGSIKTLKSVVENRLPVAELDRGSAQISDDLRLRLQGALREDVARLRTFMGNGFDGWGIL